LEISVRLTAGPLMVHRISMLPENPTIASVAHSLGRVAAVLDA